MLFENGILALRSMSDQKLRAVLEHATERAASRLRPSDLLDAALERADPPMLAVFSQALAPGCAVDDVRNTIEAYNPPGADGHSFDGRCGSFSPEALAALNQLDKELRTGPDTLHRVSVELLVCCVLQHLDAEDRQYLGIVQAEEGARLLRRLVEDTGTPMTSTFDAESHRLRSEEYTESARAVLAMAAIRAGELGYDKVLPPHIFLGLLGETEGVAEKLVRLQAQPQIGPARVAEVVATAFRLGRNASEPPELTEAGLGAATADLLNEARRAARLWGAEQVDAPHLMLALLDGMPPRLESVLRTGPLELDLIQMRRHLDQHLRDLRTQGKQEVPFRLPTNLLPSVDMTCVARTDGVPEALHLDAYFDPLSRALYRRKNNHVLITGLRGVGKTALLWELARRAAAGDIAFLRRKRFLWVDCRDVAVQETRAKLEAVFHHVSGRTDLVLCLDGLGTLLRAEGGSNNKPALRTALRERRAQIIGVLSDWDYEELVASDHELLESFTRVTVEEPELDPAMEIVRHARHALEQEYKVEIEEKAADRAVLLSADYILNERLPAKALRILRRVCEDLDFDRTQRDSGEAVVSADDVIRTVAEVTGVPQETLSGTGGKTDYAADLKQAIIGQDDAVEAVATVLRRIKAGRVRPGKPAAVLLFVGLTGVGKTELAKTLARFYSASKRLQTYTMANFTEPHSISGIVGVPPGYVGHEQGGRLINDLNSDPYCVFLLDEAEKAHPDVWKPFLNLFDEAWIVDQRATKAFADRAIFILTSNVGQKDISDLAAGRESIGETLMGQIVEHVRQKLLDYRGERSTAPTFSPEFLARITQIIVFKPLTEQAMRGICDLQIEHIVHDWRKKYGKEVLVSCDLRAHIARESHEIDRKSGYKEGGRIVGKLVSQLVEDCIQREGDRNEDKFRQCHTIELSYLGGKLSVTFGRANLSSVEDCLVEAAETLERLCNRPGLLGEEAAACALRLENSLSWLAADTDDGDDRQNALCLAQRLCEACSGVDSVERRAQDEVRSRLRCLAGELRASATEARGLMR